MSNILGIRGAAPGGGSAANRQTVPEPSFAFYSALTDSIVQYMAHVRARRPRGLAYKGLDLSHAFEASLYFGCVHDEGLRVLFERPGSFFGVRRLASPAARLIAVQSFAKGPARAAIARIDWLVNQMRTAKRRFLPLQSPAVASPTEPGPPILFLARSERFARYMLPVADALKADCAFLVHQGGGDLRRTISAAGHRVFAYEVHSTRVDMGRLLADYTTYLANYVDGVETALLRTSPRVVVIPEGNSAEDEIVSRVAQAQGIESVCLQQGWSPIAHPGFRNMSYSQMLVWGAGFAELLAADNPQQRFAAVGNYSLPVLPSEHSSRAGVLFLFQGFDNWLGGRRSAEAMLTLVEQTAEALPASPVFIRPHPVVGFPQEALARLAHHPNVTVERPDEMPLAQALAKARVSVSAYSTTILESIAAGTVPLIFNTTGMPHYWPNIAAAGAGLEIRDPEEARRTLLDLLDDEARLRRFERPIAAFTERFFSNRGGAALEATVGTLRQLAGC